MKFSNLLRSEASLYRVIHNRKKPIFCIMDLAVLLCSPNFSCILSVLDGVNQQPSGFM